MSTLALLKKPSALQRRTGRLHRCAVAGLEHTPHCACRVHRRPLGPSGTAGSTKPQPAAHEGMGRSASHLAVDSWHAERWRCRLKSCHAERTRAHSHCRTCGHTALPSTSPTLRLLPGRYASAGHPMMCRRSGVVGYIFSVEHGQRVGRRCEPGTRRKGVCS